MTDKKVAQALQSITDEDILKFKEQARKGRIIKWLTIIGGVLFAFFLVTIFK